MSGRDLYAPPILLLSGRHGSIVKAWSAETSATPGLWTPDLPSIGQCAVTALLIQVLLGGTLMRGMVGETSHYWNAFPNGSMLDLTVGQFKDLPDYSAGEFRSREYVMAYPDTAHRYWVLCRNFTLETFLNS